MMGEEIRARPVSKGTGRIRPGTREIFATRGTVKLERRIDAGLQRIYKLETRLINVNHRLDDIERDIRTLFSRLVKNPNERHFARDTMVP